MAHTQHHNIANAIFRIFSIIKLERREISTIYLYAIFMGLLQLTLPLGIQSIISFVMAGSFSASMVILIAGVVLGVLFAGMLQISQMKLNEKIQQNIFVQYSFEFAYRIPRIDLRSVDKYYMPELVNRFFEVISLQKGLSKLLLDLPVASIQIVFGLLLLSFYNSVFILFGLLLIVILWLIIRFTSRQGFTTSIAESTYKFGVAAWLQEAGRVMKSLKFARTTGLHLSRTDANVSGYLKARTEHFKILLIQYWSLVLFKVLITLAMLVVGAILLIDQQLNVGQFVATEIVIITVLAAIEKFILSLDKVYDVLTSVEKLGIVIDNPLESDGSLELSDADGLDVSVQQVSFSFDDDQPVIRNLNFEVPAGKMLCITGPEGSGKSTVLRLLTGAFSEFEGQILINGVSINNYKLDSLRNNTGIFFSQQDIFEGSLWDNITLGSEDIKPQELVRQANKIGLGPFLASLKDGFDTQLDPMGRRLSKSVRQRILLLRAVVGHPKLLLLEDPWEGLEAGSQQQLVDYLQSELKGCTVVVASSSHTFIKAADLVHHLPPLTT